MPVIHAYLGAAAIGVTDLEAAVALYTDGLGLREIRRQSRQNRIEVVLESRDGRGSQVVLMDFTDGLGRNFQQNPGKLVFYVNDPEDFAAAFTAAGGRIIIPPAPQPSVGNAVVGFGRDLDNNLIEIVGNPTANAPYLSAFGVGVSDLQAARDFYVDTLGFEEDQFLQIPGQYDEYILTSPVPGSSAVVLMNWTNGSVRNYQDNPVALVLEVSDPQAYADRIEAVGLPVTQTPVRSEEPDLAGAVVGYAEDADGTVLEIRQSIRAYLGAAGIGVDDLGAAADFYKQGLGMREVARRSRSDRDEVVLESADRRGSHLVLMGFTDGIVRNYRRNPGKLVFYVRDAAAFAQNLTDAGGTIILEPVDQGPALGNAVVGFGRDLDNNLIEIVQIAGTADSYLSAFGIGVSDLESSRRFYEQTLGLRVTLFLQVPGQYDEYILQGQGGSALVLMQWLPAFQRNYTDNPVKLEMRTLSPQGFVEAIRAAGERVTAPPAPSTDSDRIGEIVASAKDRDGTVIEVLTAPWGR